jgi:hypothetical protein
MSGSQYPLIVDQGTSAKICTVVFSNVDGGCEWELSSEGLIAANNSGSWLQKKRRLENESSARIVLFTFFAEARQTEMRHKEVTRRLIFFPEALEY